MSDKNQKPEFEVDPALAEFESMLGECQLGESTTDIHAVLLHAAQATTLAPHAKQSTSGKRSFWWPAATIVASVLALGFAAAWLSARQQVQVETKIVERIRYVSVEKEDEDSSNEQNDPKVDSPVIEDSAPNLATDGGFDFPPLTPKAVTFLTLDVTPDASAKPARSMLRLRNEAIANGADQALAAANYRQGSFPTTRDDNDSPTLRDLRHNFLRDSDSDVVPHSFILPGENS